jgi:hypothetical protein
MDLGILPISGCDRERLFAVRQMVERWLSRKLGAERLGDRCAAGEAAGAGVSDAG